MPVSKTMARALPETTDVPMCRMFFRSPMPTSEAVMGSEVLATGADSPVRLASWTEKFEVPCRTLASAGMWSPDSISTMSPGTSSLAGIETSTPSLTTLAAGADIFFRAARLFSARYSWMSPIMAFMMMMANMAIASTHSLRKPETRAAPIRTQIIRPENWSRKMSSGPRPFFSWSSLGPCFCRRFSASSLESPFLESETRLPTASSLTDCHHFASIIAPSVDLERPEAGSFIIYGPAG